MPRLRAGDLAWFLREARRRPPAFLARKMGDLIRRQVRGLYVASGGDPYAPRWRDRAELVPLLSATVLDRALDLLAKRCPAELEEIRMRAGRIAGGERRVLGLRLDEPPDGLAWHRDVSSGRSWPVKLHTRYAYAEILDREHASDVKVPWELSRLQHLPALALAYRECGDQRLVGALVDDVSSWRRANPVGFGVNWVVGMEVAFRAVSLLLAHDLLVGTAGEERLAVLDLPGLLGAHGRFLYRNLEYSDVNGNHYTSCLLGLLVLGLALPSEREAARWVELAVRELRIEILAQTHPDGVCHEGSIPYHGLVLELFVAAELFARRRGLDLGDAYRRRLGSMGEFVRAYTKPNGSAPAWGDGDDGRLVDLSRRPVDDHRALQAVCAAALRRDDLAVDWEDLPGLADLLVLCDADTLDAFDHLPAPLDRPSAAMGSSGFPGGGFYVLRRGDDYCLIDCGDVGLRGRGGHGHHDTLSIEVSLAGLDVLTDTGTASYTRSLGDRVLSISAASHSVAVLAGREPAAISSARLPHAGAIPAEVLCWDPERACFAGRHLGWRPVSYRRRVLFEDRSGVPTLLIEDVLRREEAEAAEEVAEEITWRFHFAARWEPCQVDADGALLEVPGGPRVRLALGVAPAAPPFEASFERAPWFPSYGRRCERWAVRVHRAAALLPVVANFRLSLEPPTGEVGG